MRNPLGLLVGDEPYVRSPQQVTGDRVAFYCNVREGMELQLLEAGDMITGHARGCGTRQREELCGISGLINFHCILRTLDLEQKGSDRRSMGPSSRIFPRYWFQHIWRTVHWPHQPDIYYAGIQVMCGPATSFVTGRRLSSLENH